MEVTIEAVRNDRGGMKTSLTYYKDFEVF